MIDVTNAEFTGVVAQYIEYVVGQVELGVGISFVRNISAIKTQCLAIIGGRVADIDIDQAAAVNAGKPARQ